jgi:peptide-methionine (S)-S-oxide reductase
MADTLEMTTLGGGCFWCVEAVYQELQGVQSAVSGYAGGTVENPTYYQVCNGTTGHAEVVQITFDPRLITFEDILYVFWRTHNPTTLNRQGYDVGTQYRSVIFYHSEQQRIIAEQSKRDTDASGLWPNPIVTEISPATTFYKAEEYHQNYYRDNPYQPYCVAIIDPKITKLRKEFRAKLKDAVS